MKPFLDISLYQFIDRKKVAKKGKQIQERLENNIFAFESAFAYTSDQWRKSGNWPTILKNLESMFTSICQALPQQVIFRKYSDMSMICFMNIIHVVDDGEFNINSSGCSY